MSSNKTITIPTKMDGIKNTQFVRTLSKYKFIYLLALPAVIVTIIFSYIPMAGLVMAFQKFDIFKGFIRSPFVGLDNFIYVFNSPQMLHAIYNTLLYGGIILFGAFPVPIILAMLFNELNNKLFKRLTQTITYLPYFLSWISVVTLMLTFFSLDGTFNDLRQLIFGGDTERINILMEPKYFLLVLFMSHLWKNMGWSSVIFLSAITSVDSQLYEAANIDGCNRFKQAFYITLPSIMPTAVIILILSSGTLVTSNFEQVFGLQNLYTVDKTDIISTVVFRKGLQNGEYSLATAFGLAQGLCSFILVLVSNKIASKYSGQSIL